MRRAASTCTQAIAVALCAFVSMLPTAQAELPNAPEKQLIEKYCVSCHGIDRIENEGGSVSGWSETIRRMVRWGTKLPPADIAAVASYLARELPVRPRTQRSYSTDLQIVASADVAVREISMSVRAAADQAQGTTLTATFTNIDPALIVVGQRARVFSVRSRALSRQGLLTRVTREQGQALVEIKVPSTDADQGSYIVEVNVERGRFLSIPIEAIMEADGGSRVYMLASSGAYVPHDVEIGLRGDRYAQVLGGLMEGEHVVTRGTFFVDAEHELTGK